MQILYWHKLELGNSATTLRGLHAHELRVRDGFLVERYFLVEKLDAQYAVVRPPVKDDVRELSAAPRFLNLPQRS